MSELASDVALIMYHRFHGCFWRPCLFSFDLSSVCLWFRLLHKWVGGGGGGAGVFPLVETEQTAAHLLVCIYLLFKMGSGCMELLGACFWTNCTTATKQMQQTVLQQQRKPNRLYYSNKANPTDCTTATKKTQQIVLQQHSKPNRLYYSNKANPTDCTTAIKQTQQIVLQQQSKPNRLYYSNTANPTDCTTATKQTQQIVLQQHSKPNRLYYSNTANSTN